MRDVKIARQRIPRGVSATLRAVALIRHAITEGSQSWKVRQRAVAIVQRAQVEAKDYQGELQALWDWSAQNLRYTRDPATAELVHSAELLLDLIAAGAGAGDCDDQSVLLGALAASIGQQVQIRIVGDKPEQFRHVHLRIKAGQRWISADLTAWPKHDLGYEPKAPFARVFTLDGKELSPMYVGTLQGLGEGPFEMSEDDIAHYVGQLGYEGYDITDDGQVLGFSSEQDDNGLGFFGPFKDVVGAVTGVASSAGEVMSNAAPVVGMVNPKAGASLAAAGAAAQAASSVARGVSNALPGGRRRQSRPTPPRPAPPRRAPPRRPTIRTMRIQKTFRPTILRRPANRPTPPQQFKSRGGAAGGGESFVSQYKLPLILGGVALAAGGIYLAVRRK